MRISGHQNVCQTRWKDGHILELLLAQQIVSDIQSLYCLLCDTVGMSLHHTQELPRGDSFWAGQKQFVLQFIITVK